MMGIIYLVILVCQFVQYNSFFFYRLHYPSLFVGSLIPISDTETEKELKSIEII